MAGNGFAARLKARAKVMRVRGAIDRPAHGPDALGRRLELTERLARKAERQPESRPDRAKAWEKASDRRPKQMRRLRDS